MGLFQRKTSNDLISIHADNISNKDWVILIEAGTIVGPSPQRIRVARWMQERKIVKKYDIASSASMAPSSIRTDTILTARRSFFIAVGTGIRLGLAIEIAIFARRQ